MGSPWVSWKYGARGLRIMGWRKTERSGMSPSSSSTTTASFCTCHNTHSIQSQLHHHLLHLSQHTQHTVTAPPPPPASAPVTTHTAYSHSSTTTATFCTCHNTQTANSHSSTTTATFCTCHNTQSIQSQLHHHRQLLHLSQHTDRIQSQLHHHCQLLHLSQHTKHTVTATPPPSAHFTTQSIQSQLHHHRQLLHLSQHTSIWSQLAQTYCPWWTHPKERGLHPALESKLDSTFFFPIHFFHSCSAFNCFCVYNATSNLLKPLRNIGGPSPRHERSLYDHSWTIGWTCLIPPQKIEKLIFIISITSLIWSD